MKKTSLILVFSLVSFMGFAQNNDQKFKGWKKAETEHFTFVYEDAQREAAEGFAKYADEAWNKIAKVYGLPQKKTEVFITGRTNTVNAFTYFSPVELGMFTNPVIGNTFGFRDNWQKLFITHELIHAAQLNFEDKSDIGSTLFGPLAKTFDIAGINGWALEGLTTVLETELTNGGRGRSPYFELNYKACTLDNGFISYEDIGMEKDMPVAQNYVMGYLIVRSIADRFGLQALADIERNRAYFETWEESVKFVTGVSAQDIYRDARIALAKKYADERKIPEGIIISPRERKTEYYTPAIINADGTLILLRKNALNEMDVVKLDPSKKSGKGYIEDKKSKNDSNQTFKETVLFSGSFADNESVTADENGTVYASLKISKDERCPGFESEASIHVWNEKQGLKRLTKNVSLFQPSVSRNGKTLVAVEQHGLNMRLVCVDTKTGGISVLLEKPGLSFIQPNVNADGTKVAFMVTDDTRARVAVCDISNPQEYQIVANDEEKIYDPSKPTWNSDGNLLFCCNYRGRLEMYEIDMNKSSKTPKAVVADPIGAIWAYKTSRGIYYSSDSSSGYVIKMKPESEWGVVPDFDGPSPAGEIIHLGDLENDYNGYNPYSVVSEAETEETVNDSKKVKHRSQVNIEKAEKAESTVTELQNEKNYFCAPRPYFYMPYFAWMPNNDKSKTYYGFGGFTILTSPILQNGNAGGAGFAYFTYFPEINNFNFEVNFFGLKVGHTDLDITLSHTVGFQNDEKSFVDKNKLSLGYTVPILNRQQGKNAVYLAGTAYAAGIISREAVNPQNLFGNYEIGYEGYGGAGMEFLFSNQLKHGNSQTFDIVLMGNAFCDRFVKNPQIKFGAETELSYSLNTPGINYGLSLKGRYTPFTKKVTPPNSGLKYAGRTLDCTEPFRLIPNVSVTFPGIMAGMGTKLYAEGLISGNFDNLSSIQFDKSITGGLELVTLAGASEVAYGASFRYDFGKDVGLDSFKFYIRAKVNWFRL